MRPLTLTEASGAISGSAGCQVGCALFMGTDFRMGYFGLVHASILDSFRVARRGLLPVLLAGLPFSLLAACSSAPLATYDLTPAGGRIAARAGRGQLAVL